MTTAPVSTLETLATAITASIQQGMKAQANSLKAFRKAGEKLLEAKREVKKQCLAWGTWVMDNLRIKKAMADRYIRLFREWDSIVQKLGERQESERCCGINYCLGLISQPTNSKKEDEKPQEVIEPVQTPDRKPNEGESPSTGDPREERKQLSSESQTDANPETRKCKEDETQAEIPNNEQQVTVKLPIVSPAPNPPAPVPMTSSPEEKAKGEEEQKMWLTSSVASFLGLFFTEDPAKNKENARTVKQVSSAIQTILKARGIKAKAENEQRILDFFSSLAV